MVGIEGTSPLLMNAMSIEAQEQLEKKSRKITDIPTSEEEAERGAYRMEDGTLCIPARCMKATLVNGSSWYKFGKRSAKQFIAGSTRIDPYEISLGTKEYEIDKRPVVIQGRSRVIRSRACLKKWKADFNIVFNEEVISDTEIIKKILEESGVRIGILDNRPQRGGENGTFVITHWKVTEM